MPTKPAIYTIHGQSRDRENGSVHIGPDYQSVTFDTGSALIAAAAQRAVEIRGYQREYITHE